MASPGGLLTFQPHLTEAPPPHGLLLLGDQLYPDAPLRRAQCPFLIQGLFTRPSQGGLPEHSFFFLIVKYT